MSTEGTVSGTGRRVTETIVRDAVPDDAMLILDMTVAGYAEYRDVLVPESGVFRETVDGVRAWLERDGGFVATVDDEPAGCVRWSLAEDHAFLYIGRLAVVPAHRRQGIGAALVAACERRAADLGIGEVRLAVRISLPHLRAMYERMGYEAFDEEVREGFGPIATWMRRRLG